MKNFNAAPVVSFTHTFEVSVYEPVFTPNTMLTFLDIAKFTQGSHKIEIGHIEGECCQKRLYAIVRRGKVVRIEAEKCKEMEAEEITDDMKSIFEKVSLEMARKYGTWTPMPVKELIDNVVARRYDTIFGTGAGCFYICIWSYCLFCCRATAHNPYPSCWTERRKPYVVM
jgi:hypothetical protein